MLRIAGVLIILLLGFVLLSSLFVSPTLPPSGTGSSAATTPIAVAPAEPPRPLTPEEIAKLEEAKLQELLAQRTLAVQGQRTAELRGVGYVRLDELIITPQQTRARLVLFVREDAGTDIVLLHRQSTALVAGPINLPISETSFPVWRWGEEEKSTLVSNVRERVPVGAETQYEATFPALEATPARVALKMRLIAPLPEALKTFVFVNASGAPMLSLTWDFAAHKEIALLKDAIDMRTKGGKT